MTVLYREFTLRNPSVWAVLCAFIKANAAACLDRGRPLRVIVTEDEKKRNAEQNKFYWAAVITPISEQAWVDGRRFDKDTWHEYFARRHGVCEELVLPGGEIVTRRKSTTQMTVGEFSEFIAAVQAEAATDLGVQFNDF